MQDALNLSACTLCPRRCAVNRNAGGRGRCGETAELRVAAALVHRGEEPPITGQGGSGTVFITGCGLGCRFCQNYQVAQNGMGRAVGEEEFARICLALEEAGAENINLVTGTHAAGALAAGIRAARTGGLKIPVLWNSSAYERPDVLDRLAPWVDGYLPDLKTLDQDLAERLLRAPDYPRWAASAVLRMMAAGPLLFDRGMLKGGVIIRHLAIPGHLEQSRQVLEWFAEYARGRAFLSLMTQYTPAGPASREPGSAIPKRRISQAEHERLLRWLEEFAIEDGFYQEPADGRDWLPDFRRQNPFSAQPGLTGETRPLALPLWHWREGFLGMPEKGAHTPPVFPPLPREGLIKSSF